MFFNIQNAALFLLAAPPSGGAGGGSSMVQTFVFMGMIFMVFWFFMIRPQRQKQKKREAMLKAIGKGDRIVTIGGIRGTVAKVNDEVLSVKVDDNCRISFNRSAVADVIVSQKPPAAGKADGEDEPKAEKTIEQKVPDKNPQSKNLQNQTENSNGKET